MNDMIQPYLQTIMSALVSLLTILIVAALAEARKRTLAWLESRTNNEQRELLHKLAGEAFSFAETVFKESGGPQKLDAAYGYLSSRLKQLNIDFGQTDIKAAIEKAVLDYNSKNDKSQTLGNVAEK